MAIYDFHSNPVAVQYQNAINEALMESQRLSVTDVPDVTDAELKAKEQEILADDSEMDDIAVDVMESGEFVAILRLAQIDAAEAGRMISVLAQRMVSARADLLLG